MRQTLRFHHFDFAGNAQLREVSPLYLDRSTEGDWGLCCHDEKGQDARFSLNTIVGLDTEFPTDVYQSIEPRTFEMMRKFANKATMFPRLTLARTFLRLLLSDLINLLNARKSTVLSYHLGVRDGYENARDEARTSINRTDELAQHFADALRDKLEASRHKHGWDTEWMTIPRDVCNAELINHVHKGDPRDVAAFCAFMWYHGWDIETQEPPEDQKDLINLTDAVLRLQTLKPKMSEAHRPAVQLAIDALMDTGLAIDGINA